MAGSYNHVVKKDGSLRGPTGMMGMLDAHDTGDTYEAIEEMYGMIWYLAQGDADKVEDARRHYYIGLTMSPGPKKSRVFSRTPDAEFDPNWCLGPWITLNEWITHEGIVHDELAGALGIEPEQLTEIREGKRPYDARIAVKLGEIGGVSAEFWWNLQNNYLLGLAQGKKDMSQ